MSRRSKQELYYWCEHGEHWMLKVLAQKQSNGRLICPEHKKALRLSSNIKEYKHPIVLPLEN